MFLFMFAYQLVCKCVFIYPCILDICIVNIMISFIRGVVGFGL